ncbi:MAG: hypothetical protein KF830_11655 [Planctomycetes bacterium]|nr:hypothetical protein [Planctomycetota bacterium]
MPSRPAESAPCHEPAVMPLLLRGLGFGVGVLTAAVLLAWSAGLLPAATTSYAVLGVGAAVGAGVLALAAHRRILARATGPYAQDGRLLAGRLQGLLGAAFAAKLAVLVLGMLYVNRVLAAEAAAAKFAATASFAIAFAAASLVLQLGTAGYVARALGRARRTPVDPAGPAAGAAGGTAAGALPMAERSR